MRTGLSPILIDAEITKIAEIAKKKLAFALAFFVISAISA
jgi:hypothetical protein